MGLCKHDFDGSSSNDRHQTLAISGACKAARASSAHTAHRMRPFRTARPIVLPPPSAQPNGRPCGGPIWTLISARRRGNAAAHYTPAGARTVATVTSLCEWDLRSSSILKPQLSICAPETSVGPCRRPTEGKHSTEKAERTTARRHARARARASGHGRGCAVQQPGASLRCMLLHNSAAWCVVDERCCSTLYPCRSMW